MQFALGDPHSFDSQVMRRRPGSRICNLDKACLHSSHGYHGKVVWLKEGKFCSTWAHRRPNTLQATLGDVVEISRLNISKENSPHCLLKCSIHDHRALKSDSELVMDATLVKFTLLWRVDASPIPPPTFWNVHKSTPLRIYRTFFYIWEKSTLE